MIVGAVQEFVNEPKFRRSTTMKYLDKVIEIAKEAAFGQTHRSGRTPTNLKSEIVHFKNDEPSMFFELKKGFFVNFLTKVLSSRLIENYFDEMGIPGRSDYGGHHSLRNKVKKYPSSQYKYVYQT
ncbi:uncharacterized protein LOC132903587 [Amyelois transitella]|uniref:uncharacterized protein LOC132903587 n=1 Tax=Amyelois transitella TaxID=680683 RepID=UPI00298F43F3|nr:uncharacterized protein LOC132903587 [Amyelois transitella]